MGIGTLMLRQLEVIALENGFKGFSASVLCENTAMLRVFRKCYPDLQSDQCSEGELTLTMDFNDSPGKMKSE